MSDALSASRLRCGEDVEKRFSELLPSIGALSWLRAQGVHPDPLSVPDLPCAASIVFSDHAPLFDFGDEAAEETTTKALIFLERNGFGEPVDLVAWTLKPRPRLASWLGNSVLGATRLTRFGGSLSNERCRSGARRSAGSVRTAMASSSSMAPRPQLPFALLAAPLWPRTSLTRPNCADCCDRRSRQF